MNNEIQKVDNWLLANQLSVHYVKKTQFILFIPRGKEKEKPPDFQIKMGENTIEQTPTYKYLGVIIDEKLNWKPQIDKLCAKLSSVCGILSKVRYVLDRKSLLLIYNSLVESRLRYGILSWSTASDKELNRLKVLQNRALRYIDFSPIGTTILPIYAQFKVLPLDSLIALQRANYMFSLSSNQLPTVFRSYCKKPTHRYETRFSKFNYCIPSHNVGKTSIKVIGPKMWADIPNDLKKLQFRKTFSNHLKQKFLGELPTVKRTKKLDLTSKKLVNEDYKELHELFYGEDPDKTFLGFEN